MTGAQAVTPADFQSLVRRLEDSVHAQVTGQVAKVQGEVQRSLAQVDQVAQRLEQGVASQVAEVRREVTTRIEHVEGQVQAAHARVDSQESNLQALIQNLFSTQTQRLEELLMHKRPRCAEA